MINKNIFDLISAASDDVLAIESEIVHFRQTLLAMMANEGISQIPSELDEEVIRENLFDFFKWVTLADLKLASRLHAVGKLLNVDQHYGTLNTKFISSLLNSYKEFRGPVMVAKQSKPTLLLEEKSVAITNEQWLELYRKDRQLYREGKYIDLMAAPMCDWLERSGRIQENTFTDEEWRRFDGKAKQKVMTDRRLNKSNIEKMPPLEKDAFRVACINEKKRLIYIEFLKNNNE